METSDDSGGLPPLKRFFGPYLAALFRVALGVIFVVASWDKIADPLAFAHTIANYHLLPLSLINLLAICLPWVELVCGFALILGLASRSNLLAIGGMLLMFIAAIGSALWRKLDISCGCFSTGNVAAATMTRWTLYWDVIWLMMAIHAFRFDRGVGAISSLLFRKRTVET